MMGGDLDNSVPPRVLLVFEGLLGTLPDAATRTRHALDVRRKRWDKAAGRWEINHAVINVVWRMSCRVELVTFRPEAEAEALLRRLESGYWPFASFQATTSGDLARMLAYRPDIRSVCHAQGELWATFGHKGRVISPAHPDDLLRAA